MEIHPGFQTRNIEEVLERCGTCKQVAWITSNHFVSDVLWIGLALLKRGTFI